LFASRLRFVVRCRCGRLREQAVKKRESAATMWSGLSSLEAAAPGSARPGPSAAPRRLRRPGPALPGAGEASMESKGGSREAPDERFRRGAPTNPYPVSSDRSFLRPTRLPLDRGGGSRPPKAPRSGRRAWRRRTDPKTIEPAEEGTATALPSDPIHPPPQEPHLQRTTTRSSEAYKPSSLLPDSEGRGASYPPEFPKSRYSVLLHS